MMISEESIGAREKLTWRQIFKFRKSKFWERQVFSIGTNWVNIQNSPPEMFWMLWKYAAKLQENTHAKLWFQ